MSFPGLSSLTSLTGGGGLSAGGGGPSDAGGSQTAGYTSGFTVSYGGGEAQWMPWLVLGGVVLAWIVLSRKR